MAILGPGTPICAPTSTVLLLLSSFLSLRPIGGKFKHLDANTIQQVFDPEIHRFACPHCFTVVQLVPYPLYKPGDPWDQAATNDLAWHPSCAEVGAYEDPHDPADADQRPIGAIYLYLRLPDQAIC